jgi:GNAT superfamily N-acetyltransferase
METSLFPRDLISKDIAASVPAGYTLRPLQSGDYDRGVLEVLTVLTTVGEISRSKFLERFEWLCRRNDSYFIIVIENDANRIVGVGSLLIEAKFIHSCALAGHIEDIAVAKSEQGKKLGIKIIHTLMDISEKVGCYKTTLVCADHNVAFYEKCGFVKGQNEMVRSSAPLTVCCLNRH